MDVSVIMYRNRLNQPINKFCVRGYLLLSIPIFLINTEIVPSMLVINSTWSGFLYSSIGIVISMPVSVFLEFLDRLFIFRRDRLVGEVVAVEFFIQLLEHLRAAGKYFFAQFGHLDFALFL